MVERTNLRRYENGKYVGLTSREVRSFVSPTSPYSNIHTDAQWYDGNFYIQQNTVRANHLVNNGIHDSISSVFYIAADGKLTMYEDHGYPSFRSFPSYTTAKLNIGDKWNATAERAVDPLDKGIFTKMQMLVQYQYIGEEIYKTIPVYHIKAIWQTNYGSGYGISKIDRDGDSELIQAKGGHKADILIRKENGTTLLITDYVDETFVYKDGQQINFKGNITLFTEYPPSIQHDKIMGAFQKIATVKEETPAQKKAEKVSTAKIPYGHSIKSESDNEKNLTSQNNEKQNLIAENTIIENENTRKKEENDNKKSSKEKKQAVKEEPPVKTKDKAEEIQQKLEEEPAKNNMVVEKTQAGIRLSMRDIRFKPDSSEVLPEENYRLDEIAKVLKMAPESQFLIEGHTASVGNPKGEMNLSKERARKIAEELSKRGIPAEKFICKGLGGTKPIASNASSAGKAQNRRVEITILE